MTSTILERLHAEGAIRLDRSLLKDQILELLREQIIYGRISPNARLAEQELAESLGVSRMPVRDALKELETEGLVVTKSGGRCVVQLNEEDIRNLFQVRSALEKLAVECAALRNSPENQAALLASLEHMQKAVEQGNRTAYIKSDLEAHQLIWKQAGNPYLLNMLNSIIGPITMFIASHTEFVENWRETRDLHEELVSFICSGNVRAARESIETHLESSLQLSLCAFQHKSQPR